jgi:predicted esterase
MGNWRMYDTHNVVSAALKDADGHAKIDASNVHLISLSNGGLGATQLAAGGGIDFKSLVFLSPVFDADYVETERFAAYCKARRVLIMSGKMDDRVPSYNVEANAAKLKADGVEVSLNILDAADHFMLFSHKERVLAGLEHWLAP